MALIPFLSSGPSERSYNVVLCGERMREGTVASALAAGFTMRFKFEFPEIRDKVNIGFLDDYVDFGSVGQGGNAPIKIDADRVRTWMQERVAFVPDAIGVLVSDLSGGEAAIGAKVFAVSTLPNSWLDTAMHEFGHCTGLVDEYEMSGDFLGYLDEVRFPNVTANADRATCKWSDLVTASYPWPTRVNAPTAQIYLPDIDTRVGLFEGGFLKQRRVYRSQLTCRMRDVSKPFCAVCRRHVVKTVSGRVAGPPVVNPPSTRSIKLFPDDNKPSATVLIPLGQTPNLIRFDGKFFFGGPVAYYETTPYEVPAW